jgi:WD40 repeat protein
LWDVESGRALGRLVHSNAQVHTGATVYTWDVTSGQEQQPFVSKIRVFGLTGSEFAKWVKFSPDGKSMVAGLSNGTVRMWDVASRREVPALIANVEVLDLIAKGAPLGVRPSVAYSPDSKSLAVCIPYDLNAGTVQIWDVATGQKTQERQLPVRCTSVAYVPEGKARVLNIPMGVFNSSGTAQIWDVASGQKVWQWDGAGAIFPAALSPDSERVAAFFSDGVLRMWDAASGQRIWQRNGVSDVRLAAFSADGKSLVAALSSGTVRMWDVASGQEMLKTLSNR